MLCFSNMPSLAVDLYICSAPFRLGSCWLTLPPHPQRQVSPAEVCQSYTPSNTAVTLNLHSSPLAGSFSKSRPVIQPLTGFLSDLQPPLFPQAVMLTYTPPPLLWLVPSPKVGRSYTPSLFIRLTQHPELLFWLTLLPLGWFLQKKVSHTLPVLHHVVNLPQTVHQVRTMLV